MSPWASICLKSDREENGVENNGSIPTAMVAFGHSVLFYYRPYYNCLFLCVFFLDQCLARPLDCEVHKGRGHIACLLQDPAVLDITAGMQQIFDERMNEDVFCFCFLNIHDSVWTMI